MLDRPYVYKGVCQDDTTILTATFPTLNYLAKARRSARQTQGSVPRQGALVAVTLNSVVACVSAVSITAYSIIKLF